MRIRKYYVRIDLEIHAVTCPGVCLCANGGTELTLKTLGYNFKTNVALPRFPLLYHENFRMNGSFQNATCLSELERCFRMENVDIALWQSGRRLAYYTGKIGTLLLDRTIACEGKTSEFTSQILMTPTKCFPGIIGPKVEFTSRVQIRNSVREDSYQGHTCSTSSLASCTRFSKKQHNHDNIQEFRRQSPVCHYPRDSQTFIKGQANSSSDKNDCNCKSNSMMQHEESGQRYQYGHNIVNETKVTPARPLSTSTFGSRDICSTTASTTPELLPPSINHCQLEYCVHKCHPNMDVYHTSSCEICKSYRRCFNLL